MAVREFSEKLLAPFDTIQFAHETLAGIAEHLTQPDENGALPELRMLAIFPEQRLQVDRRLDR